MYKCPKCNGTDLQVAVTMLVELTQDDGEVETGNDGDQEWDGDSLMFCRACVYAGTVNEFEFA